MAEELNPGGRLPYYEAGEEAWPKAWVLPEIDEDTADLFERMAWLADDVVLRLAVNIWDNAMRIPGVFEGVQGGMISAHARFIVGQIGQAADLERAADSVRAAWLGMARQAMSLNMGDAKGET